MTDRTPSQQRVLDEHIRRIVDAAPPLSPEQRDRLHVLLRRSKEK